MIWPFDKISHRGGPRAPVSGDETRDPSYVSRPRIEKAIKDALARGDNLVVYGPPHLGKTMLLSRQLPSDSIFIECSPGFKRTQIYRVALSSLGYAVLVEKKRKGKASTTLKLGLTAAAGVKASAEGEIEQVMQSVTVDLKNPSEVAHLISRIKHVPWVVLDNFQLLDGGTKSNVLFDMSFFAERPSVRIVIVGSWSQEDYLEEIEPAVAGKFRYVLVPTWSDAELRDAAAKWSAHSKTPAAITPHLDELLALAAGDISLFRALVEGFLEKGGDPASEISSSPAALQAMVIGRFRRGLSTKLKAIFAQREVYVMYFSLRTTTGFKNNPKFRPIRNAGENDYLKTTIDPQTNQPYPDGREVLLDRSNNPQYLVQTTYEVVEMQTDIARFLLRKVHAAVQQGSNKIDLARLAHEFGEQLDPKPVALDESRLKAVFARFDDVQRQALIVPNMLAVARTGGVMEIVDRRLFLFLQSVSLEDLEELLDSVQPRSTPSARRRNRLSPEMTAEDKAAYVAQAMPALEEAAGSNEPDEGEPDEPEEKESK